MISQPPRVPEDRWPADPGPAADVTPSSVDRIRDAALQHFAAQGTSATSLREIADTAGVSIGLVQHHFGVKAGLIKAVDDHVLTVLNTRLSASGGAEQTNPVNDFGHQVTTLIIDYPHVVDYIGRMLIDGCQIGSVVFDSLAAMGQARWERHSARQLTPEDLDLTWAALNPMILVLGAIILRAHIDRHLPEPFTTAAQLTRWEAAMNTLIRQGQLRVDRDISGDYVP